MDHVHEHLRAYMRATAELPGGEAHEDGGVLWVRGQIPWPMFNGAIVTPARGDGAAVDTAVEALAGHGLPWFLWVLPDTPGEALAAAGRAGASAFDEQAPWMEAPIASLPDPQMRPGVTIEEVADEAGHRLWAATLREIYGFPELGEQAWTMPAELSGWEGLPWRQWIAYVDGDPAAVTLMFCGGGVAGLFGVGVKPEYRRRGLGSLVTLLPLKESGERLAGFFATPDGAALYRPLGFADNGWVSRWLGSSPFA